jgi:hypothetical protein
MDHDGYRPTIQNLMTSYLRMATRNFFNCLDPPFGLKDRQLSQSFGSHSLLGAANNRHQFTTLLLEWRTHSKRATPMAAVLAKTPVVPTQQLAVASMDKLVSRAAAAAAACEVAIDSIELRIHSMSSTHHVILI